MTDPNYYYGSPYYDPDDYDPEDYEPSDAAEPATMPVDDFDYDEYERALDDCDTFLLSVPQGVSFTFTVTA